MSSTVPVPPVMSLLPPVRPVMYLVIPLRWCICPCLVYELRASVLFKICIVAIQYSCLTLGLFT